MGRVCDLDLLSLAVYGAALKSIYSSRCGTIEPCSHYWTSGCSYHRFDFPRMPGRVLMIISLTAFSLGPILLATAPVNQTYWAQVFVSFFVMPFGMYVASIALFISPSLIIAE